MNDRDIKKRIEEYRKAKHYSQADLAEKLSISQAAYYKIEKGDTTLISDHLSKIASALDLSDEALVLGYDPLDRDSCEAAVAELPVAGGDDGGEFRPHKFSAAFDFRLNPVFVVAAAAAVEEVGNGFPVHRRAGVASVEEVDPGVVGTVGALQDIAVEDALCPLFEVLGAAVGHPAVDAGENGDGRVVFRNNADLLSDQPQIVE